MSFRRNRPSEGSGIPGTLFRTVGDRHFDPDTKTDYVLRDLSGTLTWVKATPDIPPPPTLNSLGAAKSTVGAGLPSFAGRKGGDQHYNQTDKKEYVLTGAAGVTGTDSFNRANGTLAVGAMETGAATYSAIPAAADNQPKIISNLLSGNGGFAQWFFMNLGTGFQSVAFDYILAASTYDGPDVGVNMSVDGATGYRVRWKAASPYNTFEVLKSGTIVATIATSYTVSPGVDFTFEVTYDGAGTVKAYANGTEILTYTDTAPLAQSAYARIQYNGANGGTGIDNLSALAGGTLAWISTDEYVAAHTHPRVNTSSAGPLPDPGKRTEGDLHFSTDGGRLYVVTEDTAPEVVVEDFTGVAGALQTTLTSDGSKTWALLSGYSGALRRDGAGLLVYDSGTDTYTSSVVGFDMLHAKRQDISITYASGSTSAAAGGTRTLFCRGTGTGQVYVRMEHTTENRFNTYFGETGVGNFYVANTVANHIVWAAGDRIRIICDEQSAAFYRNDVLVAEGTLTTPWAGRTKVGVEGTTDASNINFDNLRVEATGPGVLKWTDTDATQSTIGAGLPAITTRRDGDLHYNTDDRFHYVLGTMFGTRQWQPVLGKEVQLEGIIQGTASVGNNKIPPGLRVPHATTVREIAVEVGTAPVGGPLTVEVRRKSDNGLLGTVSVADGGTSALLGAVDLPIPEHDRVIFNITAVGPTTAGADVAVALECR